MPKISRATSTTRAAVSRGSATDPIVVIVSSVQTIPNPHETPSVSDSASAPTATSATSATSSTTRRRVNISSSRRERARASRSRRRRSRASCDPPTLISGVLWRAGDDLVRAVDLLEQDDPGQLVWERHLAE